MFNSMMQLTDASVFKHKAARLITLTAAVLTIFTLSASAPHVTPVTILITSNTDVVSNDGKCTLREAITASNTHIASGAAANECAAGTTALDSILFSGFSPRTINLTLGELPAIVRPVIIHATSRVQVRGGGGDYVFKFDPGSAGSKLLGMTIGNADVGVLLDGGAVTLGDNWIGTNAAGTGPDSMGIGIEVKSSNNRIGFIDPDGSLHRNVLSGNDDGTGVDVDSGSKNIIQANFIGTNPTGTVAVPNQLGIETSDEAVGTLIGGNLPFQGNVISGNSEAGLSINGGMSTRITRNLIGTDVSGLEPLGNGVGLEDYGTVGTIIGGKMPEESNLFAANGVAILLESASTKMTISGNFLGVDLHGNPLPNDAALVVNSNAQLKVNGNLFASHLNPSAIVLSSDDRAVFTGSNNCFEISPFALTYSGTTAQKFANNWWGDSTGPSHSTNPDGFGGGVADNITFKPYLTTPPTSCNGWGPAVTSPANNSLVVKTAPPTLTLKWKPIKTSSIYIYKLVGVASGTIANNVETSAAQTIPLALNYDRYTLSLQTKSADGAHWAGPGATFWVTIMKAPKPEAQLKAGPVKLMWEAYPGAVSYSVSVYTSDPVCGGMPANMPNFVGNSMTVYLAPGFNSWRVQPDNGPLMPCQPFTVEP